jgi:DNA-binding NarL/FixJ family response regulator
MGPDKPEVHNVLTPSEIEILKLIARGKSAKEIAAERVSSIHTIITHKKNIFRKLEVNNVYEATKYALRAGLIEMVEYYI